jgi:alpha-L-arabinofuranosidase
MEAAMRGTRRHRVAIAALCVLLGGFLVSAPSARGADRPVAPVGYWTFDGTAGDSSGHGNALTPEGGASYGAGLIGSGALAVNGNGQYAAAPGPVLDTSRGFTVSAWVSLVNLDGYQTFVSQDGGQVSAFYLQLRGDSHRFAFTRVAFDSTAGLGFVATSPIVPQTGVWYHLAGVYDSVRHTIALYVNGILQQRLTFDPAWSSTGPFAVGRGRYAGNPVDFCAAAIDDVRAYQAPLDAAAIAQLAGTGRLSVALDSDGPAVNPTQFGAFLEEINHSGDGGIYAELIRNRDLKESADTPAYWSAVGGGRIALDTTQPLTAANPVALRLAVPAGTTGGVANEGYWGIAVTAGTTYRVSFFAKADPGFTGPLTVSLRSDAGRTWASATVAHVSADWARYTTTLTVPAKVPASTTNRFVIAVPATAAGSSLWLDLVSLLPPVYDKGPAPLRADLMRDIAATHPGFFRVPGGNYLEGDTVDTRFAWKDTVGPIQDRPGHQNTAWGYWSQDGLGLLEYLELAEEVGATPVLAVYAGYSLNGSVVPAAQLGAYVQDAVDEIEYATGDATTPWGARRIADGHPAAFDVRYVEIGNEDQFDRSGSYGSRYGAFYDAIHARYPRLKLIATTAESTRPMDVIDNHYYFGDPAALAALAHTYDATSRTGPKVLVGEYAVTQGQPTGTLAAALGEAAFMTGLVRDADVVIGASYAPLLVDHDAPNWSTNLIGYDAGASYGSPSYWVQRLFGANLGDRVAPVRIAGGDGELYAVATRSAGRVFLTVVNRGAAPSPVTVDLPGGATGGTATVLAGAPTATNSLSAPDAVVPHTFRLGTLGASFRYAFPASSVTVLALNN